jgi:anti-sigma B factor antagonist
MGETTSEDVTDGTAAPFSLRTAEEGSAVVVSVAGELDLVTAPQLMEVLDRQLARPDVELTVVDLSEVEFLGSSGLGVLASIATRATAPTDPLRPGAPGRSSAVRLVAPPTHRPVVGPWTTMNLQEIVPLHPDVPAALAG